MRKVLCVLLILCCVSPALGEEPLSVEELLALYPVPEVSLETDPAQNPLLRLVNKQNGLKASEKPELVTPDIENKPGIDPIEVTPEVSKALENMFAAAKADGMELGAVSGYRSYYTQKSIYERKVKQRGKASASFSSAPPGKSEHQLGMAVDVSCKEISYRLNKIFLDAKEGQWLHAHCAEYGFIIRYKSEWSRITGYKGEPWHVRYVGVEHATFIQKLNVPFETYLDYLNICYQQNLARQEGMDNV